MALLVFVQLCVVSIISINAMTEELPLSIGRDALTSTEMEVRKGIQTDETGEELLPMVFARGRTNQQWGGGSYTKQEQKAILAAHNNYRKAVEPSASNMNELVWSPALADQAQRWSDGCFYEHDPNRHNYQEYNNIGQNLFITWSYELSDRTPQPAVTKPIDDWYNEVQNYHYDSNTCGPKPPCGHYTQVVWANTKEVGCGIKYCPKATDNDATEYNSAWLITCNYSPSGNYAGESPYKAGEGCSECEDGFCSKNLCSECKPLKKDCECNIACQNGGTLNEKKCFCQCSEGFRGAFCEENCEDQSEDCELYADFSDAICEQEYWRITCPALCGECTPRQGNVDQRGNLF